jgi:ribosomal protein S8
LSIGFILLAVAVNIFLYIHVNSPAHAFSSTIAQSSTAADYNGSEWLSTGAMLDEVQRSLRMITAEGPYKASAASLLDQIQLKHRVLQTQAHNSFLAYLEAEETTARTRSARVETEKELAQARADVIALRARLSTEQSALYKEQTALQELQSALLAAKGETKVCNDKLVNAENVNKSLVSEGVASATALTECKALVGTKEDDSLRASTELLTKLQECRQEVETATSASASASASDAVSQAAHDAIVADLQQQVANITRRAEEQHVKARGAVGMCKKALSAAVEDRDAAVRAAVEEAKAEAEASCASATSTASTSASASGAASGASTELLECREEVMRQEVAASILQEALAAEQERCEAVQSVKSGEDAGDKEKNSSGVMMCPKCNCNGEVKDEKVMSKPRVVVHCDEGDQDCMDMQRHTEEQQARAESDEARATETPDQDLLSVCRTERSDALAALDNAKTDLAAAIAAQEASETSRRDALEAAEAANSAELDKARAESQSALDDAAAARAEAEAAREQVEAARSEAKSAQEAVEALREDAEAAVACAVEASTLREQIAELQLQQQQQDDSAAADACAAKVSAAVAERGLACEAEVEAAVAEVRVLDGGAGGAAAVGECVCEKQECEPCAAAAAETGTTSTSASVSASSDNDALATCEASLLAAHSQLKQDEDAIITASNRSSELDAEMVALRQAVDEALSTTSTMARADTRQARASSIRDPIALALSATSPTTTHQIALGALALLIATADILMLFAFLPAHSLARLVVALAWGALALNMLLSDVWTVAAMSAVNAMVCLTCTVIPSAAVKVSLRRLAVE